jgi:spore coat protein A
VAVPDTTKFPGVDYYKLAMQDYRELLHPDLPGETYLWGYADATNPNLERPVSQYLGPAFLTQRGRPARITHINRLPPRHPLPVDHTLMGAEWGQPENRAVVHLHGGLTPWTSDGGPYAWSTPGNEIHGVDWQPGDYLYPNNQSARLLWYHDHAVGITRLNAYVGLAGPYLIADSAEAGLVGRVGAIPDAQIPLVIQDKTFVPKDVEEQDPTWEWGKPGDLWYPHVYEPNIFLGGIPNPKGRWDWGTTFTPPSQGTLPLPRPACEVPEAFFDTIVVNGAVYPYLEVEPRRYRFRVLNGSQARFYNLQLYVADYTRTEANLSKAGPAFIQIGTEGGFLPAPVVLNKPPVPTPLTGVETANPDGPFNLLLSPAERADLIIDFRGFEGATLILYNDAPAPFPGGDSRNDYFTGDADQTSTGGAPATRPGHGPNTRTLMQIRVKSGPHISGEPNFNQTLEMLQAALPIAFSESQPPLLWNDVGTYVEGNGKTLNEDFDDYGRLIQRLGTTNSLSLNNQGLNTWGLGFMDPVTEIAHNGETQIWNIFNLTGDTHPVHFHLVNVQVISRAPFDAVTPDFTSIGAARPPDPNELGWKETVRMNPGEVTTVIMQFNAPDPAVIQPWIQFATSPRTGGYEYVWHCHILDHEEHDMMRSLVVMP